MLAQRRLVKEAEERLLVYVNSEVVGSMGQALRIAWYRYRATFARQLTGYLTVVLLIGLIGGIGMAAVAGARRTQSSYPQFLASTNASDLTMAVFQIGPRSGKSNSLKGAMERLPGVKHVVSVTAPSMVVLGANGAARLEGFDVACL